MDWIKHPHKLTGGRVSLVPLEEYHFEELIRVSGNKHIWTYLSFDGTDTEKLLGYLKEFVAARNKGEQYPFIVIENATGNIIGTTSYLKINEAFRSLEIGWTWYIPEYWSKGYNEECKLLLLRYSFEELKAIRVQLVALDKNMRSRKAIERIGAKFEGIHRDSVIREGVIRSVAYYSILEREWNEVELLLLRLIAERSRQ